MTSVRNPTEPLAWERGAVRPPEFCCVPRNSPGQRGSVRSIFPGHGYVARARHPWRASGDGVTVYCRNGSGIVRIELRGAAAGVWSALGEEWKPVDAIVRAAPIPAETVRGALQQLLEQGLLWIIEDPGGGSE